MSLPFLFQTFAIPIRDRLRFVLTGLVTVTSCVTASAAEGEVDTSRSTPLTDLVLRTGETTARVRLVATIDGRAWRDAFVAARERQVAALFRQLDSDDDGGLSMTEAKRLPKPQALLPSLSSAEVHVAFNFRVLDIDRDNRVSRSELARYLESFVGQALVIDPVDAGSTRSRGDLFDLLDTDRDGRLTAEECRRSAELWRNDRDGNHVLATNELQRPQVALYGQEFVARPLQRPRQTTNVQLEAAGDQPADLIVEFDLSEGLWSREEGLAIRCSTGTSQVPSLRIARSGRDSLQLAFGDNLAEVRLVPPSLRRDVDLQQTILRQFDAAADPETGILKSSADLPMPLKNLFAVADHDGDGRLARPELQECVRQYVASQLASESSRVRLTVHPQRNDLLALADGNLDGRLSGRELPELARILFGEPDSPVDVGRGDLPAITRIVLQRGPFAADRSADSLPDCGPPWFFHADRNRDGDLESGEFLGEAALFQKWDRNHDGWIDLSEAIAADRQFSSQTSSPPHREGSP